MTRTYRWAERKWYALTESGWKPDPRQGPPPREQLSALRIYDPAKWARTVKRALESSPTVQDAADELGVSWRTLMRWRAELEISADCK